jgi:hypothetical protein
VPLSIDVTLPKDAAPEFPSVCVGCCAQTSRFMRFRGSRFAWAELLFVWSWLFRKREKRDVPVCSSCRPVVRRRRWLEAGLLVAATWPAVSLLYPWLKEHDLGRQWNKLILLAVVFAAMFPYYVWSVLRPPLFDMTVRKDMVEYEFATRRYAEQFLLANADAVVQVEGLDDDDDDDDGEVDER